jgi:RNA recognition motif-containing protein
MDAASLESLFSSVGDVRKVSLQDLVRNGVIRRVAYVEMSSAAEVRDCIDRFHGMSEGGHTLTVTEDKPHVPDPELIAKRAADRKAKKKTTSKSSSVELAKT